MPELLNGVYERRPASHLRRWVAVLLCTLCLLAGQRAQAASLADIDFVSLPGDKLAVTLTFDARIDDPLTFATDEPPRIALDFPGATVAMEQRRIPVGVGGVQSIAAVEAGGRSRVVLNLDAAAGYTVSRIENRVELVVDGTGRRAANAGAASRSRPAARAAAEAERSGIANVDFRRGNDGEGRIIITLDDPNTAINTRENGNRILVDFSNVALPAELERTLDVTDFATPVRSVRLQRRGRNARMTIAATGNYDHLVYQSDRIFSVDVRPLSAAEEEELARERFEFTGEKLSLNFQNIEVRAVLQLFADFTDLNIVASDTVQGSLTLRLKNVPWDQALDLILRTKGLAKRQLGNVLLIAPTEEITAREKLELEAAKQLEELTPLRTEYIQVNYARASDLRQLILNDEKESALLSERGSVGWDDRTNTLLIRDVPSSIDAVRSLVNRLDVSVRQVLIEARVVVADESFNRELGIRWGVSQRDQRSAEGDRLVFGGTRPGNFTFGGGSTVGADGEVTTGTNVNPGFSTEGTDSVPFIVDLPTASRPAASIAFAVVDIPNFLLQLELQALQVENRGEILSNPRVVTTDGAEAFIEQGVEIPFEESTSSGATSVTFKKAVLSLTVTPRITPDDRVSMQLAITQDSQGDPTGAGPAIDTREVQTQVLVSNGDTIVLGGIFEQTKREDSTKVPFFGNLPYVGKLFRNSAIRDDRTELLVFVTPRILDEQLTTE